LRVVCATLDDIAVWLQLAAEVEYLFGPMVDDPNFIRTLGTGIQRQTAFCIRVGDGTPGSLLLGGLLWSAKPHHYKISWLAVCSKFRQRGAARALVNHALALVDPPADVWVTTFGEDVVDGCPALRLYQRFGFIPCDNAVPNGPEGGSRQKFRKIIKL
jgi:ribosomal protein S18 acetylase RimI-like enzyme